MQMSFPDEAGGCHEPLLLSLKCHPEGMASLEVAEPAQAPLVSEKVSGECNELETTVVRSARPSLPTPEEGRPPVLMVASPLV